jgi:hypothetical protein
MMTPSRCFYVDVCGGRPDQNPDRWRATANVTDAWSCAAKLHREKAAGELVRMIPPYDLRNDEATEMVALGIRRC